VLLHDERPGCRSSLLEVAVSSEHFLREEDRHRLGEFCGNSVLGVLRWIRKVCLSGVSSLDFLERESTARLPGVGLVAVLDVGGGQLAPVEGGRFCHFTPLRSYEGPHALSGLACHDSARSPRSVMSPGPLTSS